MTNEEKTILIKIQTDVEWLKKGFDNHLEHHKTYMYLTLSTCIGLVITLLTLILKII